MPWTAVSVASEVESQVSTSCALTSFSSRSAMHKPAIAAKRMKMKAMRPLTKIMGDVSEPGCRREGLLQGSGRSR
eukprot:CAMPEP_0115520698 /NCGR_PEP_ID=MMETSP0271-20121206/79135_1 /TAXON_ID=71861 /ORGANISM="Scrippsiella trochoidea, Strain CCMP3099" /LENGTH=74 /DNA_ID=CAMNT_0002951847 /DNA_START=274 /DNA_END=495 /DNA_ORIENTATION=+